MSINAEWTNADSINFKPYTTYIHIPDNDDVLTIVCGGEQITIPWKDLFKLLKWAYGQGMGGWMLGVLRASCEHHLRDRHDEGRGDCRMEQEGRAMTATDELHRMLDERGVEWDELVGHPVVVGTEWYDSDGCPCTALEHADDVPDGMLSVQANLTPEQAIEATLGSEVDGKTSDGYHTFNELYHHRAVLFSVIVRDHRELAWKARKHHDGSMYDGMFIVGIETPKGQATYHYDLDPYWDMFDCEERELAPEWDGHTPDEAIARIATLGRGTCHIKDGKCDQCGAIIRDKAVTFLTPTRQGIRMVEKYDASFCPNCGRRVMA